MAFALPVARGALTDPLLTLSLGEDRVFRAQRGGAGAVLGGVDALLGRR